MVDELLWSKAELPDEVVNDEDFQDKMVEKLFEKDTIPDEVLNAEGSQERMVEKPFEKDTLPDEVLDEAAEKIADMRTLPAQQRRRWMEMIAAEALLRCRRRQAASLDK